MPEKAPKTQKKQITQPHSPPRKKKKQTNKNWSKPNTGQNHIFLEAFITSLFMSKTTILYATSFEKDIRISLILSA